MFLSTATKLPYSKLKTPEKSLHSWANRTLKNIFKNEDFSLTMLRHSYISRKDLEMEKMTGTDFPEGYKEKAIKGSSELDLVRSGLEDTMRNSYQVISDVWNNDENAKDLRTAAMMVAIKRVAQSYTSLGM